MSGSSMHSNYDSRLQLAGEVVDCSSDRLCECAFSKVRTLPRDSAFERTFSAPLCKVHREAIGMLSLAKKSRHRQRGRCLAPPREKRPRRNARLASPPPGPHAEEVGDASASVKGLPVESHHSGPPRWQLARPALLGESGRADARGLKTGNLGAGVGPSHI
jgi:hypothetical protein